MRDSIISSSCNTLPKSFWAVANGVIFDCFNTVLYFVAFENKTKQKKIIIIFIVIIPFHRVVLLIFLMSKKISRRWIKNEKLTNTKQRWRRWLIKTALKKHQTTNNTLKINSFNSFLVCLFVSRFKQLKNSVHRSLNGIHTFI